VSAKRPKPQVFCGNASRFLRQSILQSKAGAARRIYCYSGMKGEQGSLVVPQFEFLIPTDTVEKLGE
jgi:hypothetical protein